MQGQRAADQTHFWGIVVSRDFWGSSAPGFVEVEMNMKSPALDDETCKVHLHLDAEIQILGLDGLPQQGL